MMNAKVEDLSLIGLDTKEVVHLGPGIRTWDLLKFRGPVFDALRVTHNPFPVRPRMLLPADLLVLLYKRFAAANPSGVTIAETNELDDLAFGPEVNEDERNRLFDAGEVCWEVFDHRIPPHGRDPIRRYLPELFEPEVIARILADPTLDGDWLRPNQPGPEANFGWDDAQHYRWSDWWLNAGERPPEQPAAKPKAGLFEFWRKLNGKSGGL